MDRLAQFDGSPQIAAQDVGTFVDQGRLDEPCRQRSVGIELLRRRVTPPGKGTASVIFGEKLTDAAPGSVRGLHLVTPDLEAARAELSAGGAEVSEVWHDADGIFHWAGAANRLPGAHTEHDSYSSYISFDDPDGNEWIVQQVVDRLPGR